MEGNRIGAFSELELRSALSLVGTPESAAAVAAQLYALGESEQVHYNWINTTLVLLACVSDELAQRVFDRFGRTPELWARLEAERASQLDVLRRRPDAPRVSWSLGDVVHDTREDQSLATEIRRCAPARRNIIALFSQGEVSDALKLLGDDPATAVAAELYGLPPERQVRLNWTDFALGLLSCSVDVPERIEGVCTESRFIADLVAGCPGRRP